MNKDQLQTEILKKVKPGVKPSDLKKLREKNSPENNSLFSTKIPIPPILPPKSSKKEDLPSPIVQLEPEATIRPKSPVPSNLTPTETKPPQYIFTCDICEQNKKSQLHLGRVNGLGIDPHKTQKICDYCIRKVDLIPPKKEDFF